MRALACLPAAGNGAIALFNWFVRARDWYVAQPRLNFEAITFGLALLVGLLVMPLMIYAAGRFTLEPYANGGLPALYFDFFKGLFRLRASFWIVALGPFVFLTVARLFRLALRKL
jgi:hypothetical protein